MRIIHISDIHIPNNRGDLVYGSDPYNNLERALQQIKIQYPSPDLVVLGGDLLDDGKKGDYSIIKRMFKKYKIPINAAVLGNHDDLINFKNNPPLEIKEKFCGFNSFYHDKYHFIFLYSSGSRRGFGNLDEPQLIWLKDKLKNSDLPVLIFMHHPPVTIGVPWLDKINLVNSDDFWKILMPFKGNIIGVFVAHLHISLSILYKNVLVCSCPSISCQFNSNAYAVKAQITDENPGFNIIDLNENMVKCRTVRLI